MSDSITGLNSIGQQDAKQLANLHRALAALGFKIDSAEQTSGKAGRSTLRAVRAIERGAGLAVDRRFLLSAGAAAEINRRLVLAGLLDGPANGPSESLQVEGTVRGSDGVPIAGLGVQAFDQDLRSRQALGSATTDASGRYIIAYSAERFARAEKGYADIVVQVTGKDEAKPRYESEVQFNAAPRLVHDIRLDVRGPSLYVRVLEAIEPLATEQKVALAEVDENDRFRDVSFLAGESGLDATPIIALAVAARLSRDTALDQAMLFALILSGAWSEPVVNEVLALRDLDLCASRIRARFGEHGRDHLRTLIATAVKGGTIDASAKDIEAFVDALLDFADRDAAHRPGLALSPSLLRKLLGDQVKGIEHHFNAGTGAALVERLTQDPKIPRPLRRRVEALVFLDTATLGDCNLVEGLARKIESPEQVGGFARLDSAGWAALLKKTGKKQPPAYVTAAGGDMARYSELLSTRFRSLFPTQAFVGDLERDTKAPKALQELGTLVDADPAIDFAALSLTRYAKRTKKRDPNRRQLLKIAETLKPVQRLYKVAPSYAAVAALSKHGLGSAQAVYHRGRDAVMRILTDEAGMTARAAEVTYERAAATAAASLQLAIGLVAEADVAGIPVMNALSVDTAEVPELGSLFRLGNDCACADCSSVLSPAAYLADLMLFLSNRDIGGGRNAKDVLLSRRPDLAWIDLNCANAFTPLPYIDLAIEAMEDLIAPFVVGTLTAAQRGTLPSDSADHPVPAAVVTAFSGFAVPITVSAQAYVRRSGTSWVLREGGSRSWRVLASGEVGVLRNTHGTAAERELMPEYASSPASAALAGKSFPWTLPLDPAGVETTLSLAKLGIARDALIRELRGPAAPNNGTPIELAAAHLDISAALATLLVTPAANPGPHWGTTTTAQAVTKCTPVPAFLAATGLTYAELLRLLALPYANTAGCARDPSPRRQLRPRAEADRDAQCRPSRPAAPLPAADPRARHFHRRR
jgi:hypothetical protein